MRPAATIWTPTIARMSVVLPEPLGPSRPVTVPLRVMCPHAELLLGRLTGLGEAERVATVEADMGTFEVEYEQLVVALGAITRALPIPGLGEHALGFKSLADAIHLRNHVLRQLELADAALDPAEKERHLSFLFVGAGYAGVEALAELSDLVHDALRHYPRL